MTSYCKFSNVYDQLRFFDRNQSQIKISLALNQPVSASTIVVWEISPLNHKLGNDSVEGRARIPEPLFAGAQSPEILGRSRNNIGTKFNQNLAQRFAIRSQWQSALIAFFAFKYIFLVLPFNFHAFQFLTVFNDNPMQFNLNFCIIKRKHLNYSLMLNSLKTKSLYLLFHCWKVEFLLFTENFTEAQKVNLFRFQGLN
jgi:hypothetical protein